MAVSILGDYNANAVSLRRRRSDWEVPIHGNLIHLGCGKNQLVSEFDPK